MTRSSTPYFGRSGGGNMGWSSGSRWNSFSSHSYTGSGSGWHSFGSGGQGNGLGSALNGVGSAMGSAAGMAVRGAEGMAGTMHSFGSNAVSGAFNSHPFGGDGFGSGGGFVGGGFVGGGGCWNCGGGVVVEPAWGWGGYWPPYYAYDPYWVYPYYGAYPVPPAVYGYGDPYAGQNYPPDNSGDYLYQGPGQ